MPLPLPLLVPAYYYYCYCYLSSTCDTVSKRHGYTWCRPPRSCSAVEQAWQQWPRCHGDGLEERLIGLMGRGQGCEIWACAIISSSAAMTVTVSALPRTLPCSWTVCQKEVKRMRHNEPWDHSTRTSCHKWFNITIERVSLHLLFSFLLIMAMRHTPLSNHSISCQTRIATFASCQKNWKDICSQSLFWKWSLPWTDSSAFPIGYTVGHFH